LNSKREEQAVLNKMTQSDKLRNIIKYPLMAPGALSCDAMRE
jgi:hypothetical protein